MQTAVVPDQNEAVRKPEPVVAVEDLGELPGVRVIPARRGFPEDVYL
jgi:hypothetical protein